MTTYWHKQTPDKPLFPDILWSKPENKLHAGKLLIVGGNLHGFSAPATAFAESGEAGIGSTRVVLPSAIQKTVGSFMPEADFAPSTPSGSFAASSLDTWLEHAAWADAVLLPGDLGRNSETAIVLEKFLAKHKGQVTLTKDALDYCLEHPTVMDRPSTTLVCSFAAIQKIARNTHFPKAFTFDMGLVKYVEHMHEFSQVHQANIVSLYQSNIVVAVNGQVSTTPTRVDDAIWRVKTSSHASVWWLQHDTQPFEALTTAVVEDH